MSACDCWASFKFSQIILCLSCLLYKRWSDAEATRLFYFFEKTSREWPLLNNITRNGAGSLFADVTFGGYIIICIALYIAYLMGELKNSRKTESFLLVIGAVLFIGVGCLVMTAVDSVPKDLVVNALILGTLSVVTGMVFILDTCLSNRRDDKKSGLPKNTRYGDIARTTVAVDAGDASSDRRTTNGVTTNGVHANGVHATNGVNGKHVSNGVHANGKHASNGVHANGKHASNGVHANGKHASNGVHMNGKHNANGVHGNESILKQEKKENGLLQTAANKAVRNEGVQTAAVEAAAALAARRRNVVETDEGSSTGTDHDDGEDEVAASVRRYGRRYLENRGFDGRKHADWYDTDMDLPKMKKLEINVSAEGSPDYRRRFANVTNGVKLQSPSITSTVQNQHQQQESPKEENEHEVKNARVPYISSDRNRRPARPTDLPLKSPVERINDSLQKSVKSRFYFGGGGVLDDEPKSPNDPGYVLRTASRWEEQPQTPPQNVYKNFKRSQV